MSHEPPSLRRLHLLASLEEADPLGAVIPLPQREQAGRAVGDIPDRPQAALDFLLRRAEAMLPRLPETLRNAVSRALCWPPSWIKWSGLAVMCGAFLLGWLTNELGSDRTINILSFPLLGLTLWNVLVCSGMLVGHFRKRRLDSNANVSAEMPGWRRKSIDKGTEGIVDVRQREIVIRGIGAHQTSWASLWRKWHAARLTMLFHCGALLLAGGVVAGMYFQGLRKEYRAAWESTFLNEHGLRRLLDIVLGPAAKLTGIPIPPAETLAAMRMHPDIATAATPGDAAPFIHLWAVTAALFIGLPRSLLLAFAWAEKRRSLPDFTAWAGAYLPKVRRQMEGTALHIQVIPLHFTPDPVAQEAAHRIALQVWGGKSRVELMPKVELGKEDEFLDSWQIPDGGAVVFVSLSATPEMDVQGQFIHNVRTRMLQTLVLADAAAFEEHLAGMPEAASRLAQRQKAWERVIGAATPLLLLTNMARKDPDAAAAEVRRSLDG